MKSQLNCLEKHINDKSKSLANWGFGRKRTGQNLKNPLFQYERKLGISVDTFKGENNINSISGSMCRPKTEPYIKKKEKKGKEKKMANQCPIRHDFV